MKIHNCTCSCSINIISKKVMFDFKHKNCFTTIIYVYKKVVHTCTGMYIYTKYKHVEKRSTTLHLHYIYIVNLLFQIGGRGRGCQKDCLLYCELLIKTQVSGEMDKDKLCLDYKGENSVFWPLILNPFCVNKSRKYW